MALTVGSNVSLSYTKAGLKSEEIVKLLQVIIIIIIIPILKYAVATPVLC